MHIRILFIALIFLANCTFSFSQTVILLADGKLKESSSALSEIIEIVPEGCSVTILSKASAGYYKVYTGTHTGYMSDLYWTKSISNTSIKESAAKTDSHSCICGDCKTGKCVYKDLKKGYTYTGYFYNGVFQGQGAQVLANGDEFKGIFRAGKRHGNGFYPFKGTGGQITDIWSEGILSSRCTYKNIYTGEETIINVSYGTSFKAEGKIFVFNELKEQYEIGQLEKKEKNYQAWMPENERCVSGNCENGSGTYIEYKTNSEYIGLFRRDSYDGQGKLTYSNGDIYEGYFAAGLVGGY